MSKSTKQIYEQCRIELNKRYSDEIRTLKDANKQLQDDYAALRVEKAELENKYKELENKYKELEDKYMILRMSVDSPDKVLLRNDGIQKLKDLSPIIRSLYGNVEDILNGSN